MGNIQSFTGLTTWQQAHRLVLEIYRITKFFPSDEKFGLSSQLRRVAVSVSSNIAEGFRRRTKRDKRHFYEMAQSSRTEVQNTLLISRDVGYLVTDVFQDIAQLTVQIAQLITGLSRSAVDHPSAA